VRDGLADERVGGWHVEHILSWGLRQVNEVAKRRSEVASEVASREVTVQVL
jgi:hypothetical protein